MRRKKILSVVLIVFMVVSGCFGNYMGQVFHIEKVLAEPEYYYVDGYNVDYFSEKCGDFTFEAEISFYKGETGYGYCLSNATLVGTRIYTTEENCRYSSDEINLRTVAENLAKQVEDRGISKTMTSVYRRVYTYEYLKLSEEDFRDAKCDFSSINKLTMEKFQYGILANKLIEKCGGTIEVEKDCEYLSDDYNINAKELIFDGKFICKARLIEGKQLEKLIFKNEATFSNKTFANCPNLKSVEFDGNTTFDGKYAFDIPGLETVSFSKGVTFNQEAKNFSEVLKNGRATFIFKNSIANGTSEFTSGAQINEIQFEGGNYSECFRGCNIKKISVQNPTVFDLNTFCNCKIISLEIGNNSNEAGGTVLKNGSISGGEITNLSIEKSGNSAVNIQSGGLKQVAVENMNLNSKVSFEEAALQYTTINNLYVNVDVDNNLGVCSSAKTSIGKNTTIKNIHFNYHDINKNVEWNGKKDGKVNQLISFPLGTTTDTSVNADNIYFYNPNFNYIKNSSYKRGNVGTTKIYYYGGTNCKDASGNMISMDTLMKKWVDGDTNCKLASITGENFKVDYKDASLNWSAGQEIKFEDVLCVKQTISVDNLQQYTGITSVKDKDLSMSVDCKESGNTAYRILKKSDVSSLSTSNYNYQYDNSWYTQLTQKSDVLVEGDNKYLVEVGGCVHPLVISASSKQKKDDSKDPNKIEPTTTPKVVQTPEPTKTVKPTDAPQASVSPNVTEEPTVAPQPTGETDPNEEGKILQKKIKKASLKLNVESKNSYFKLNYSMSDDVTPKEFVIYYSIKSNKNFKKIANVSGTVNTYSWTNASVRKNGTKVYFMVIALFENEDIVSTKKTSNVVGKVLLAPAKSAVIKQIGNAARITWKKSNSSHGYLLEMTFRNDANKKYTRKFKVKGMKKTTLNLSFNKISSLYRKKLGSGRIYFHKATVTAYYKDNRGLTYASKCKVKVK